MSRPPDNEDTVDIGDTDDRTVVVDRDEDRTVVVDRDEDRTVVVRRRPPAAPAVAPDPVLRLLPARGAETYPPRPIAPPPPQGPEVERAGDPLRTDGASLPSVARGSRTAGALALLVFGGACVVSLIGIVAVVVWFIRG